VRLVQLVRFLVVELIHSDSNPRFDMSVAFTANYSFSERRRPIDSVTLLVTDFVNLKIKPTQSFRGVHRNMVYILIEVSDHTYINIYVYTVLKKTVVASGSAGCFQFPSDDVSLSAFSVMMMLKYDQILVQYNNNPVTIVRNYVQVALSTAVPLDARLIARLTSAVYSSPAGCRRFTDQRLITSFFLRGQHFINLFVHLWYCVLFWCVCKRLV
jgi:hypothetical protein